MQTNGTLLDDEWAAFFKEHNFLIGISIDGPAELHDVYRVDKGGGPTFDKVMRGMRLLQKHGVEYNVLTTVNRVNADYPLEVYRFLRDEVGTTWMQFIPVVERINEDGLTLVPAGDYVSERSVGAEQFGRFLSAIFDEWVRHDVGTVFVQTFEAALRNWLGMESSGMCVFNETCGTGLAIEHNGDLLLLRPLRRAELSPRQHQRKPHDRAGGIAAATQVRSGQVRCAAPILPGVRRALRLPRRVPQESFHRHARRRAGSQLPLRRLQAILPPHRFPYETHGRAATARA